MELLKALIIVSEKAANIARVCRKDEHLFKLLVQRKKRDESNPRFVEDFKTLADVLIQEMVKHDIKKQFQQLSNNINGEENNTFKNILGETISVEIKHSTQETSSLLETVLNGDRLAADLLSAEAHREMEMNEINTKVPEGDFSLNMDDLAIWIDPIDCTAEYIHGGSGRSEHNIHINGLECVTILIGVFSKASGVPLIGVVNRPFLEDDTRCIWGTALPNFTMNSGFNTNAIKNVICISSSEEDEVKEKLKKNGLHLIEASGAGYKILTVILGLADAYLVTKGTTFQWDTCAPHAILRSMYGDIVDYKEAIHNREKSLEYSDERKEETNNCNLNGIIAYRNKHILTEIVEILSNKHKGYIRIFLKIICYYSHINIPKCKSTTNLGVNQIRD